MSGKRKPSSCDTAPLHLAVGLDIVDVDRVEKLVGRWRERFLNRVFTAGELKYSGRRMESLAARFAAKEALAKALSTGRAGFGWRDVEVVGEPGGPPTLKLHGKAAALAARMGVQSLSLSLSHTRHLAAAVVVALKSGEG
jgi:holo-[acyl-carrier protein] synthase